MATMMIEQADLGAGFSALDADELMDIEGGIHWGALAFGVVMAVAGVATVASMATPIGPLAMAGIMLAGSTNGAILGYAVH